jgi:Zn-dependent protease
MLQLLINGNIALFIAVFTILVISICTHEISHGYAAIQQGDDTPIKTQHMTFNPLVLMGGVSIVFLCFTGIAWGAMPVNPEKFRSTKWGQTLVSVAGPLANLALSVLAILILKLNLGVAAGDIGQSFSFLNWLLILIAFINLKLFFFNMLPIPPLDGHTFFSEFFPELKPLKDSNIGLAALMILLITPFGEGLSLLASSILSHAIGVPLSTLLAR